MDTNNKEITQINNVSILSDYLSGKLVPSEFEEYVTIGLAAREMRDMTQWVIGKSALEVTEKWGRGSLRDFCKEIGYGGLESTVEVYRWTAERYLDKYGVLPYDFEGKLLSYSYYREVANTDDPKKWIEIAENTPNMTIRQLKSMVKGMPQPVNCSHTHTKKIVLCSDCGAKIGEE